MLSFERAEADVQRLIVERFIDLPTRLSLALTSRHFFSLCAPCYTGSSNYRFLMECARLGYLDLLKFAYESGSPIPAFVRDAAVASNQEGVVLWLESELLTQQEQTGLPPPDLSDHYASLAGMAAKNGNEMLFSRFLESITDETEPDYRDYCALVGMSDAASRGHAAVAIAIKRRFLADEPFWPIFEAATSGNLATLEAILLTKHESISEWAATMPQQVDICFSASYISGSLELVQFALDLGARPNSLHFRPSPDVVLNPKILDLFMQRGFGDVVSANLSHIADCASLRVPSVALLEWLHHQCCSLPTTLAKSIICSNSLISLLEAEADESLIENAFSDLRFLLDKGIGWDLDDAQAALRWASLPQFKFILTNAKREAGGDIYARDFLSKFFEWRERVGLDFVAYLVAMQEIAFSSREVKEKDYLGNILQFAPSEEAVIEAAFLENNLQVLDYLHERFGSEWFGSLSYDVFMKIIAKLVRISAFDYMCKRGGPQSLYSKDRASDEGDLRVEFSKVSKFRMFRPYNAAALIRWLIGHGFSVSASALDEMRHVESEIFQRGIESALPARRRGRY